MDQGTPSRAPQSYNANPKFAEWNSTPQQLPTSVDYDNYDIAEQHSLAERMSTEGYQTHQGQPVPGQAPVKKITLREDLLH